MPTTHVLRRIPFEPLVEQVFPALADARDRATLDPLSPYLDIGKLDPDRYILTGRRYLIFGPEQRDLMHVSELLARVVSKMSAETLDIGDDKLVRIVDAIRASGSLVDALPAWEALTQPDRGLPEWIRDGEGPSLITPDEIVKLRSTLPEVRALPAIAEDPELRNATAELEQLLDHAGDPAPTDYRGSARWGLAVRARPEENGG